MIEDRIWKENPEQFVIGVDEVGRGSFAGPICATAVRINFNQMNEFNDVKDSKKLSENKRNYIFDQARNINIEYSFISSSNNEIDKFGIKYSNEKVLTKSIEKIYQPGDVVYVDHFKIYKFNSISLVKGEDNCKPIALASVIAKVLRDKLMNDYSTKYPEYLFEKNKGYGTKEHREAIKKYGLTDIHRKSFKLSPI
jgi:ribonuclease HII